MLTNWISPEALAALDEGFVVIVTLEAKESEGDALADLLRLLTPATMTEPGVKLFLPYRSPTNPLLFTIFELYVDEAAWGAHQQTEHFKTALKEFPHLVARRERIPFVPFMKA